MLRFADQRGAPNDANLDGKCLIRAIQGSSKWTLCGHRATGGYDVGLVSALSERQGTAVAPLG